MNKHLLKFLEIIYYPNYNKPKTTARLRIDLLCLLFAIPLFIITLPGSILMRIKEKEEYMDNTILLLYSIIGYFLILYTFFILFIICMILYGLILIWKITLLFIFFILIIILLLKLNNYFSKPIK
jgi:hypothetical protein